MSEENVEILRQLASFWRDRDYAAVEEAIHPDAVLDVSRNVFNPGVHRGVDGLRHFMDTTDEMWESFDVLPLEYIDAGDKVVVANRIIGTGRASGVETEMLLFAVVSFRDGKILRYTGGFRTQEEAFEAAGLSE